MEKDVLGQRWTTWFLLQEGEKPAEIFRRLEKVCGLDAPSRKTVYNWVDSYKCGRQSTDDRERTGRPNTAVNEENIEKIRLAIDENPRIRKVEMQTICGIGGNAIHLILHEHLHLKN